MSHLVAALWTVVAGSVLYLASYLTFLRPEMKRRHKQALALAAALAAAAAPEPRVPADTSRPYLFDVSQLADPEDERLSTCPICGMPDPLNLPGTFLGWPAHTECEEWLGDWKPSVPAGGGSLRVAHSAGNVSGIISTGDNAVNVQSPDATAAQRILSAAFMIHESRILAAFGLPGPAIGTGSLNTVRYNGGTAVTWAGGGGGGSIAVTEHWTREECQCGMEFAGTPADIEKSVQVHHESGQCEQRRSMQAPAAPGITQWCTCGTKFTGTPQEVKIASDSHRASGDCPHSVKGRQRPAPDPFW